MKETGMASEQILGMVLSWDIGGNNSYINRYMHHLPRVDRGQGSEQRG
jgi:hypothetical protein